MLATHDSKSIRDLEQTKCEDFQVTNDILNKFNGITFETFILTTLPWNADKSARTKGFKHCVVAKMNEVIFYFFLKNERKKPLQMFDVTWICHRLNWVCVEVLPELFASSTGSGILNIQCHSL